jgi:hypothetical protein
MVDMPLSFVILFQRCNHGDLTKPSVVDRTDPVSRRGAAMDRVELCAGFLIMIMCPSCVTTAEVKS